MSKSSIFQEYALIQEKNRWMVVYQVDESASNRRKMFAWVVGRPAELNLFLFPRM